jgi:DNA-directed RNA polymerase specialized sigma24 family protein
VTKDDPHAPDTTGGTLGVIARKASLVATKSQPDDETVSELYVIAQRVASRIVGPVRAETVAIEAVARTLDRWRKAAGAPRQAASRMTISVALDNLKHQPATEATTREVSTPTGRPPGEDEDTGAPVVPGTAGSDRAPTGSPPAGPTAAPGAGVPIGPPEPADHDSPSDLSSHSDLIRRLPLLSRQQQEIVVTHLILGYDLNEVSRLLGVALPTVKVQFARAAPMVAPFARQAPREDAGPSRPASPPAPTEGVGLASGGST